MPYELTLAGIGLVVFILLALSDKIDEAVRRIGEWIEDRWGK